MKKINFKTILPHLIAVGIFLLVAVIFCKPALQSDTILKQSDITGWQGMSHQSFEYREKHGHFPLWATNMFSGMPAYQIALEGNWSPLGIVDHFFQLWLPQPMNFFFLACICFYFLCMCLGTRTYAAIVGALGFAYCSFSPIIITAGHNTQMFALAYAPAVIGSVILIFHKKYISGFALTALFTALQIGQGHQQISYYLFLVMAVMAIAYVIRFLKAGAGKHVATSLALIAVAGIIGVSANALVLLTTYDYAKESKRGGQLVMDNSSKKNDIVKDGKTTGLSKDYAFQWSYGIGETFSLMFPGVKGYGSHIAERDGEQYVFPKLDENSHLAKYFTGKLNLPEDQANNYALQQSRAIYWGDQPFTNGPVYLGAVICFLFLFGMFYLDNEHKWWILAACVFAILLSWGHNLAGFNYFMFDHLPLYNKFRVPTMTLVIPQLLFPVIAAMTLSKLMNADQVESWKKFKVAAIAALAAFAFIGIYYVSADFSKENKKRTAEFNRLYAGGEAGYESKVAALNQQIQPETDNQLYEGMIFSFKGRPEAQTEAREFLSALREDRQSLLLSDILRSFLFVLAAAGLIGLYLRKKINSRIMLIGVGLISLVDLLGFGMKYLNDKSFGNKSDYEASEFPVSAADAQIMNDKDPNFRVFNTASLEESKTSYYHKSIGGYHPAKLGIYDDLMAYQLNGNPNISVINMLNAKYVLQQQGNDIVASRNPGALGNAWFIKAVKFVNGPVQEMKALTDFNPADTVVVDEKYKPLITAFTAAETGETIKMSDFDNDAVSYQTNTKASHLAVFSEIYYKDWNAYIDNISAGYFKANYVLRAMVVPAGNHTITFKFEPNIFYLGRNISTISTWILSILLLGFIFYEIKKGSRKNAPEQI